MKRAFSPWRCCGTFFLGRRPRLVWHRGFAPHGAHPTPRRTTPDRGQSGATDRLGGRVGNAARRRPRHRRQPPLRPRRRTDSSGASPHRLKLSHFAHLCALSRQEPDALSQVAYWQWIERENRPQDTVFPSVECPFSRQNGVSTASNPGFAGRMPIRRRRIGVPAAEWPSDTVESAFCRENGDPTGGGSPFFRQNASSTGADWHSAGPKAVRRGGKGRSVGRLPVRRRGSGVPLTESHFAGDDDEFRPGKLLSTAGKPQPGDRRLIRCRRTGVQPAEGRFRGMGYGNQQRRPRSTIDTRSESPPKYAPRNT
ncbi:MAG: hypothetical protein FD161_3137 [Limisphaerales bacterium]|nr:MAG: hypothetical protein FD161_3137 [Limisphaerales bacterium]TXT49123.1 MAG: hypothetical protein FD140_3232 [Limisphaerales bacterium]